MKYLKQFGIILVLSFIGELLNHVLPLPVPSSIYGIILMFICLKTGLIPLEEVDETGRFLIEIMPLMFIPAAVGLLEAWNIIQSVWLQYLAVTAVSTVFVMAVAGRATPVYDSPNFTTTICNRIRSSRRRTSGRRSWLWNFLITLSFSG